MKYSEKLYCHNCDTYQTFTWDLELEGNQVFYCPKCGHDHYRVMEESDRLRIAILPKIALNWRHDCGSIADTPTIQYKKGTEISDTRWNRSPNQ